MDEAVSWGNIRERLEIKRINHEEAYSMDDACTNWGKGVFLAYAPRGDWHPSPHCRCAPFAVCSRMTLERG
jgi:hypothetical protein